MIVNIVMLVKDRAQLTTQALDSLFGNTDSSLYNLTLIDDDGECVLANDLSFLRNRYNWGRSNFTILRIEKSKSITGMARNLGIYWAEKYWGRGDYLYLSDNDVYFTPGWLEKLTMAFNDSERHSFKLMGGWNHPFLQPHGGEPIEFKYRFGYCSHDAVAGASQLMRWETWDKYGPLSANAPGVCQSEDWEYCQKIIKDGGRVGSIYPRLVFNCGLVNSFGVVAVGADLMSRELQEAKRQYPDLYWE